MIPKNKKLVIAGIIIVVVLVGIGAWKVLSNRQAAPKTDEQDMTLPEVDKSVVVSLTPRADKKAVTLKIDKIPSGTESIEYQLSYNTAAGLPKGALGKITLNGESSIEREILLGTCSRSVCAYDEGVTKIDLVLRFNANSGVSIFQKSYTL